MKNKNTPKRTYFAARLGLLAGVCAAATLLAPVPQAEAASRFFDLFDFSQRKAKPKRTYRAPAQTVRRAEPKTPALLENFQHIGKNEPVQIVVSLPKQEMKVYKGGIQIATTRISSGKPGHTTPSGVYSILQKNRTHFSNLYGGAPMPFMQRLTWTGVALHAGVVPNYPASHGCIRMPHSFARQLFSITEKGGHVVVVTGETEVTTIVHKKLFKPAVLATVFDPKYLTENTSVVRGPDQTTQDPHEANTKPAFQGTHLRQVSTTEPSDENDAEDTSIDVASEMLHVFEGRDERPLRILITRDNGRERVFEIQEMLNKLGYDVGTPDGKVGRKTREAIKAFQEKKDYPVTGKESEELWSQLNGATGTWRFSNGHLYVRQGMKDLFDEPITINHSEEPLGTHLYTAMSFSDTANEAKWTAVTLQQSRPPRSTDHINDEETLAKANAVTALEALERIEIPDRLRRKIESMLTPGSSMIISDNGMDTRETTPFGSDYIVRTW